MRLSRYTYGNRLKAKGLCHSRCHRAQRREEAAFLGGQLPPLSPVHPTTSHFPMSVLEVTAPWPAEKEGLPWVCWSPDFLVAGNVRPSMAPRVHIAVRVDGQLLQAWFSP